MQVLAVPREGETIFLGDSKFIVKCVSHTIDPKNRLHEIDVAYQAFRDA
jgi:hypothetical protein